MFTADTAVFLITLDFLSSDRLWQAAAVRFGYNFLSQVAPDVARLASRTALKLKNRK